MQVFAQGDALPVAAVETSLGSTTAAGTYVLQVSRKNMLAGDALALRIKATTRAIGDGATAGTVRYGSWADAPVTDDPDNLEVVETEPFAAPFGCEWTIEGAAIVWPWILKRVG